MDITHCVRVHERINFAHAALSPRHAPFSSVRGRLIHRTERNVIAQAKANSKATKTAEKKSVRARKSAKEAEPVTWGITDVSRYTEAAAWDVPWGWKTAIGAMMTWGVSFLLVGILTIPLSVELFDIRSLDSITALQESELALIDQVVSTIAGIAIMWYVGFRAGDDRPDDYLRARLEHPFRKPDGWLLWSFVGLACAPFAIFLTSALISVFPIIDESGPGTVDGVAQMMSPSMDNAVFANLLFVTGVLAPVLEETVFRGFLLASLTKYMPVPWAVVVSSATFAACHLSARDFPQLMALGMVMGFAYVRSRNLLTSMVIHGAWNSSVLLILFALIDSGVSLEEILGT